MYFRNFFVLNRVGVSNPQWLVYTQIFVEYPSRGGKQGFIPGRSSFHVDMISFHLYCIHSLSRVITKQFLPRYRNNSNAVILDFSTLNGTNPDVLSLKKYDKHLCHF